MGKRRAAETSNLGPIWRRSLLESAMRTRTTRFEVAVVVLFIIAAAVLLAYVVPGFFRRALKTPSGSLL
jgi:hypothetical protein